MSDPEPPTASRAERRHTSRRRARRLGIGAAIGVLLLGAGAGAVVLRDGGGSSDDGGGGQRRGRAAPTTTTTSPPEDTVAAETAPADPLACLHGTYGIEVQDYRGPIQTRFGSAQLEGGHEGRTIELRPDSTFQFSDTGEAETRFSLLDNDPPITGTATLVVEAGGTYAANADTQTVTVDVTSLAGTLTAVTDDGQELDIPLPEDGTGVEETFGFTPDAAYSCDDDTLTVQFEVLTLVLERQ